MSNFHYYCLSDKDKQVYDQLERGIRQRKSVIKFSSYSTDFSKLLKCVLLDNPQYFYIDHGFTQVNIGFFQELRLNYLFSENEISTLQAHIDSKVSHILASNNPTSEYERVKYLYTLLSRNIIYDLNAPNRHNIVGALVYKRVVCQVIAYLFKLLCDKLGIKCLVVEGYGKNEPHAWNMVVINRKVYHIDVTWDLFPREEEPTYFYFCQPDSVMERDHTWQRNQYPTCTDRSCTLFAQEDAIFHSHQLKLDKYILSQRAAGRKVIHFQVQGVKTVTEIHRRFSAVGILGSFTYIFDERTGAVRLNF